MRTQKTYLERKELIEMMEKEKNIPKDTFNSKMFDENSYITIINPYKDYICIKGKKEDSKRVYPNEVDFRSYKQLKMIDHFISHRLSIYINCFENKLKAYLSDVLCSKMKQLGNDTCDDYSFFEELLNEGENRLDMLDVFHRYHNTKVVLTSEINKTKNKGAIETIIQYGEKMIRNNNELYNHYRIFYPTIPVWVIIHQLSLGELQTLFNLLKLKDKVQFVEEIYCEKVNNHIVSLFSNKINYIRLIRNIINHYEPIIPFIKRHKDEGQKEVLFEIIRILKDNYYRSEYHDKSKVIKPKIDIPMNDYNREALVLLNKIIKKI